MKIRRLPIETDPEHRPAQFESAAITTADSSRGASPRRMRFSRSLALLLGLAGAALLVFHFGDLEQFLRLLRRAEPVWLLAAVALQIATYAATALGWKLVLQRTGMTVSIPRLMPIAMSKLFADQAIPGAGIGGHVLLINRLSKLGAARSAAAATLLLSLLGYYLAYAALAVVMLIVLWLHKDATPLLVGLVTAFLFVALVIPSLALWLRSRGSEPLPARIERFPPLANILGIIGSAPAHLIRDRPLLVRVTVCNALVFLFDAMTLTVVMIALGLPFEPGAAFLALMAGSITATLSLIPMGLGSFEAAATAMLLSLGIPLEGALPCVLILRGFTLWLPLIPSFFLLRRGSSPHVGEGQ